MKPASLFLLAALVSIQGAACLNLYVQNEHGEIGYYDAARPYSISMSPARDIERLRAYETWIRTGQGADQYRYISDYAVQLIKLGHNTEALPILQRLARENPREYTVLSNLATSYELAGQPDSALKYMQQSLAINPGSHEESEWFHLRILEAIIANRDQHVPFATMNILKVDRSTQRASAYQIAHQLQERVPLTSATNPLLSKVLEESGDFYKRVVSVDWAIRLYAMAAGFSGDAAVERRLWEKIKAARARVVQLHKADRKGARQSNVRSELISAGWEKVIYDEAVRWKKHRAHVEKDLLILDKKTLWKE